MYMHIGIYKRRHSLRCDMQGGMYMHIHTCHILPHSEIDLGLCLAVFTDLDGKHLFHRIG